MSTNIGVYTICKNESKFVRKWLESMWCDGRGAARAYVLDTGSTDGTVDAFAREVHDLGIPSDWLKVECKTYDFFRFDVARNDNLSMTEDDADWLDALVSVDLDETMIPDFWDDLRDVVAAHPDFARVYYLYAWNHDDYGVPKRVFWYDKVHPVNSCSWKHPVHEELVIDPERHGIYYLDENKIYLHHWPDNTKSRGSYLPLLELRASEEPDDIYGLYYLAREYTFTDPASMMALSVANSCYIRLMSNDNGLKDDYDCLPFFALIIADVYNRRGLRDDAEHFYKRALEIAPHLRQPYISYASMLAYQGRYAEAFKLLDEMGRRVPEKYSTWYECDYNWTWRPMQIRAVACCWMGQFDIAKKVFEDADRAYIQTQTDRNEAEAEGFYADWQWLIDFIWHKQAEEEVCV